MRFAKIYQDSTQNHTDHVWSINHTSQGHIVTASHDSTVKIWDMSRNQVLHTLPTTMINGEKSQKIYSLAVTPKDAIYAGTGLGYVEKWENHKRVNSQKQHNGVVYYILDVNENTMASQGQDNLIRLWDANTFDAKAKIENVSGFVSEVIGLENNKTLVSQSSKNKCIGVWDVETTQQKATYLGHSRQDMRAFASVDQQQFLSGADSFDIKLWDLRESKREAIAFDYSHKNVINSIQVAAENLYFSVAGDAAICAWDPRKGTEALFRLKSTHTDWIRSSHFFNEILFTASGDKTFAVYPLKSMPWPQGYDFEVSSSVAEDLAEPELQKSHYSEELDIDLEEDTGEQNRFMLLPKNNGVEIFIKHNLPRKQLRAYCNTVWDLISLSELDQSVKVTYDIDMARKEIRISCKFDGTSEKATAAIADFISKIKNYAFEEYQNSAALWFYTGSGQEILNHDNYPDDLKTYLNHEKEVFKSFVRENQDRYDVVVEVGCGYLENLEVAAKNDLAYLGIDFDPNRIDQAKQVLDKFNKNYQTPVNVEHLDALKVTRKKLGIDETTRAVFLMPFNVFGNIAPISQLLTRYRQRGFDLLLSLYKTDDQTNAVRRDYYDQCGYKDTLQGQHTEYGYLFTSQDGLYTVAYSLDYMTKLLDKLGFEVTVDDSNPYGYMFYAKARPFTIRLDETTSLTRSRLSSESATASQSTEDEPSMPVQSLLGTALEPSSSAENMSEFGIFKTTNVSSSPLAEEQKDSPRLGRRYSQ